MRFAAPETLFDHDNAASCKTIYDRHKKVQIKEGANKVLGTQPRKKIAKLVVDMTGGDKDSASSTSSSSGESTSSSDDRSRSQASSSGDGSIASATGGG
jgi:hypothetical protein